MFGSILSFLSGAFSVVTSVMDFMSKKDTENQIRKGYEEEKRADALEENKVAVEKAKEAKEAVSETKEDVKAVRDVDIKDAELSKEEVKAELDEIEDEDDKRKREKEILAAAKLKKRKSVAKEKIEKDESFNVGDEVSFGG